MGLIRWDNVTELRHLDEIRWDDKWVTSLGWDKMGWYKWVTSLEIRWDGWFYLIY